MHTVTSFQAAAVERRQISAIMGAYLALERARIYRRLFVTRFGLLAIALAVIGFAFHWLPPIASWSSVGLCAVAPTWAWVAELRCDWRLERSLQAIPEGGRQTVVPAGSEKVIKSS
jgi:hypothetical protein